MFQMVINILFSQEFQEALFLANFWPNSGKIYILRSCHSLFKSFVAQ
jgi:hypothetical protein